MDIQTLQFALESGILDYTTIQDKVAFMKKQAYLEKHSHKIWQDPQGRWTTYLPTDKGRKLIKNKSKGDLEDRIIEYYRSLDNILKFDKIFMEWLNRKLDRMEIQRQSYDRYKSTFEQYIRNSILMELDFDDITADILDAYIINTIKGNQLTAKQWSNLRLVIRGTFKYAYKKHYTVIHIDNFFADMELSPNIFKHKIRNCNKQVFTQDEVDRIKEYIYSEPNIKLVDLGILLSFSTGLRAGELISLRWSDYDEENCVLNVDRTQIRSKADEGFDYSFRDSTKGRVGFRSIVLLDDAIEVLNKIKKINPDSDLIFEENGYLRHMTVFTNRLYRICDALGIERRSLHKCRKTYATKLLNSHVPEALVTSQMGHTDITTTRTYYYFNNMNYQESRDILKSCVN